MLESDISVQLRHLKTKCLELLLAHGADPSVVSSGNILSVFNGQLLVSSLVSLLSST